jgi:hypothetical protein
VQYKLKSLISVNENDRVSITHPCAFLVGPCSHFPIILELRARTGPHHNQLGGARHRKRNEKTEYFLFDIRTREAHAWALRTRPR